MTHGAPAAKKIDDDDEEIIPPPYKLTYNLQ